ncbi:MAG: hypothetical protein HRU20_06575 [Pseudomonadales bacterium]|nr:hypothetical protein [Pseudomonadales bacterium]
MHGATKVVVIGFAAASMTWVSGCVIPLSEPFKNQFSGAWHQTAKLDCGSYERIIADDIRELVFRVEGSTATPEYRFTLTYTPFETYVDYWGSYAFDEESQAISFVADAGNYIPEDIQLDNGTYTLITLESGISELEIRDMSFGGHGEPDLTLCGYVFERYAD